MSIIAKTQKYISSLERIIHDLEYQKTQVSEETHISVFDYLSFFGKDLSFIREISVDAFHTMLNVYDNIERDTSYTPPVLDILVLLPLRKILSKVKMSLEILVGLEYVPFYRKDGLEVFELSNFYLEIYSPRSLSVWSKNSSDFLIYQMRGVLTFEKLFQVLSRVGDENHEIAGSYLKSHLDLIQRDFRDRFSSYYPISCPAIQKKMKFHTLDLFYENPVSERLRSKIRGAYDRLVRDHSCKDMGTEVLGYSLQKFIWHYHREIFITLEMKNAIQEFNSSVRIWCNLAVNSVLDLIDLGEFLSLNRLDERKKVTYGD